MENFLRKIIKEELALLNATALKGNEEYKVARITSKTGNILRTAFSPKFVEIEGKRITWQELYEFINKFAPKG